VPSKQYFEQGGLNNYGEYRDWCLHESLKCDDPHYFEQVFQDFHSGKIANINKYLNSFLEELNGDPDFQDLLWKKYWQWFEMHKPESGVIPNELKKCLEFNVTIYAYFDSINRG
jgi:hypothetical protein